MGNIEKNLIKIKVKDCVACPKNPRIYRSKDHLAELKDSILKEGLKEPIIVHYSDADKKYHVVEGYTRVLSMQSYPNFEMDAISYSNFDCAEAQNWVATYLLTHHTHTTLEKIKSICEFAEKKGNLKEALVELGLEKHYKSFAHYYQARTLLNDKPAMEYLSKMDSDPDLEKISIQTLGKIAKLEKFQRDDIFNKVDSGEPLHKVLTDMELMQSWKPALTVSNQSKEGIESFCKENGLDWESFLEIAIDEIFGKTDGLEIFSTEFLAEVKRRMMKNEE